MGSRSGELVPGDADVAAQALVARGQVGDRVQLVQIERIALQQPERFLELLANPVSVVPERLAADEEPVSDRGDERTKQLLSPPVLRCDVEMVDARRQCRRQ